MDIATIVGIAIGLIAILGGNALEGGHMDALIQPTAGMIVLGGTIGAVMVGFPMPVFIKGMKAIKGVFFNKKQDPEKLIEEITEYAQKARREGVIALEGVVGQASDPFLTKSLMLAIDGTDAKNMRENLELALAHAEEEGEKPAKVWEAAGGYSPTIGIIGAVMGLIHVMQNLSDVAAVGKGIAVAFVATIYGVAFANLLFLPAAGKLKLKHRQEMIIKEIIVEGALAIQEGQNPNVIKDKLLGFLSHDKKKAAK
jgi:chemotaxis protein MotA